MTTRNTSGYSKLFFSVLVLLYFLLQACNSDESKKAKIDSKKTGVEEGKGIVIKYSISGKRKAFLTSPIMNRVQDTASYIEFPKSLHIDFYSAADTIESKLDARYAKYKENQDIVFLKDSVRVINTKGDTLYTDELYWNKSRTGMEFYTDKHVKIRTQSQIIDGIGMEAGQDFKKWHIIQPVGFVIVPSSQFPQ